MGEYFVDSVINTYLYLVPVSSDAIRFQISEKIILSLVVQDNEKL